VKRTLLVISVLTLNACAAVPSLTPESTFAQLCQRARYQATHDANGWLATIHQMDALEPQTGGVWTQPIPLTHQHSNACLGGMFRDGILYDPTPPGALCHSVRSVTGNYVTECY